MSIKGTYTNILAPLAQKRGATEVFLIACLVFLLLRLVVIFGAVDHLHNVDRSEYEIAEQARYFMGDTGSVTMWPHLWGQQVDAVLLIPMLWIGFSETLAMKFLALFISFLGFACATYLFAWKAGPVHAAILALLWIFPDPDFLMWNLTLWGSYPEAATFVFVPILCWAIALGSNRTAWPLIAGITAGLTMAYSPSILFVPAALFLLLPIVSGKERRLRRQIIFSIGGIIGAGPWLVYMMAKGFSTNYNPGPTTISIPIYQSISFPSFERIQVIFDRLNHYDFFTQPFGQVIVLIALLWTLASVFGQNFFQKGWRLLIPVGVVLGFIIISMFPYAQYLEKRHMLWFFPAGYCVIALMLGDNITWKKNGLGYVKSIVMFGVFGLFIFSQLIVNIALIQPGQLNRVFQFHGYQYYLNHFGTVVGDEAHRLNCIMDELEQDLADSSFHSGVSAVFPIQGVFECCPLIPVVGEYFAIRPAENESNPERFYEGVGCALAAKSPSHEETVKLLPTDSFSGSQEAAIAGYTRCMQLPCFSP